MPNDDILGRIIEIRDDVLEIARASLTAGDVAKFSKLNEVAVTLTEMAPDESETDQAPDLTCPVVEVEPAALPTPSGIVRQSQSQSNRECDSNMVPIFRLYKKIKYEAELDTSRINPTGSGECIWFRECWMSPSGAGSSIAGNQVNGWNFWRYRRPDGSAERIDEIRKSVISSRKHVGDDSDEESDVPW